MGSIWTVNPSDDERVDLVWDGAQGGPKAFWVRLKRELTVGEDRQVKTAGWKSVGGVGKGTGEQEIRIDWKVTGLVRTFMYLTDWSLTDEKDRKLAISLEVLESLHTEVFDLIEQAITVHVEAQAAKKKGTGGTPPPSTTSA